MRTACRCRWHPFLSALILPSQAVLVKHRNRKTPNVCLFVTIQLSMHFLIPLSNELFQHIMKANLTRKHSPDDLSIKPFFSRMELYLSIFNPFSLLSANSFPLSVNATIQLVPSTPSPIYSAYQSPRTRSIAPSPPYSHNGRSCSLLPNCRQSQTPSTWRKVGR